MKLSLKVQTNRERCIEQKTEARPIQKEISRS